MGTTRTSATSLYQVLYVSQLAAGVDFTAIKAIVQASRTHNRANGISGALLFDGERFAHLLEGGEREVVALMRRIERDARHGAIRTLHAGPVAARALSSWRSGYCESAHDLDSLQESGGLSGPSAVAAFISLAHTADLQ